MLTNNEANSTVSATFANMRFTGGGSNLSAPIVNQVVSGGGTTPDFSIFPNPTTGELMVDMAQYAGKPSQLEVYSLQGQVLLSAKMEEAQNTVRLDLSAYQNGMYLVRVKAEGLPDVTKRVVVQR